jgi:hypothetical protein
MATTTTDDRAEPGPLPSEPPAGTPVAPGEGTDTTPAAGAPETGPGISTLEGEPEVLEPPSPRLAVAVGFPVTAAAVMVGGIFKGIAPRPVAIVAGVLGVALGYGLARARRSPLVTNLLVIGGLFAIGLLMLFPSLGAIGALRTTVRDAVQSGNVLRPPVDFITGWKVIVGWLLATMGFTATWVALVFRKPALGVLLPLPLAGFAAISVPDSAQVASGIAVLVLFAIALGILSSEQATADSDDDSTKPSVAYEVRKVLKSVPVIVLLVVALVFGQKYLSVLFPKPYIDPAQEPQKPKTQPLSNVEDRVLFEVESEVSGPWRLGSLDVYDGKDWRLPPFAENQLDTVPRSGIVDSDLQAGLRARFTVAGLGGAVLPGLPNTVGVIAEGPRLSYDTRNGNIRLVSGQVTPGLTYTVAAAALPSVDDLKAIVDPLPRDVRQFTEVPDAPPAVVDLLQRAKTDGGPSKWEQFDFARTFVLENVTASGLGTPTSITPERVQEILATTLKASPYEIVATQALLARWLGIPSRIGYGFDGGELVDGKLQVRPKNGAAFPEVYFTGFKWLPVIGVPKKAEPTVGSDPSTQKLDPSILPSDDIAVQIFMPVLVPPGSVLGKQIAVSILLAVPVLLFLLLLYVLFPAYRKARLRSKRRAAAQAAGVRARVALAYAEWRDWATDFGYSHPTETPLMYLDRFIEDEEHTELAWLTTRVLWGDLRDDPNPLYATIAEELSRSLRRRLAATQPATVRAVAFVSRLSLRNPYAPETDLTPKKDRKPDTAKEQDREPVPA